MPFQFKINTEILALNDQAEENNFADINHIKFSDIEVEGEIIDGGKAFDVKGIIKCRKSFICDRCLTPSVENQVHEFNEELEISDIVDDMIDLSEIIRDNLLASQPIQNLCSENCKGLCPICGVNLNEGSCDCDKFVIDSRLAVLKNFLQKSDEEE